jgi:hypothetical protein
MSSRTNNPPATPAEVRSIGSSMAYEGAHLEEVVRQAFLLHTTYWAGYANQYELFYELIDGFRSVRFRKSGVV